MLLLGYEDLVYGLAARLLAAGREKGADQRMGKGKERLQLSAVYTQSYIAELFTGGREYFGDAAAFREYNRRLATV